MMYFVFLKALLDSSISIGNKIQKPPIWVVRLLILRFRNQNSTAGLPKTRRTRPNERSKLDFPEEMGIAYLPRPTYFY